MNLTHIHKYVWVILSVSDAVGCNKDVQIFGASNLYRKVEKTTEPVNA